jgi:DegV family protein with EDD domain
MINIPKEVNKIKYIDSCRLYYAIVAGSHAVINNQNYLNSINVFPVADGDTGTNMASTMNAIIEEVEILDSVKETCSSMANAALAGARGNSGIIFAQFLLGFSSEVNVGERITARELGKSTMKAVEYAYDAVLKPVEGTILTVMKDWSHALHEITVNDCDISVALQKSFNVAKKSLDDTPKKLKVLEENGVVDAGAKGFVDFLEGVLNFIQHGRIRDVLEREIKPFEVHQVYKHNMDDLIEKFCCEAVLQDCIMSVKDMKITLSDLGFGDSLIIAGVPKKIHLHVHTDTPAQLFYQIKDLGDVSQIKVDDMQFQNEIITERRYPIALITDTACDLPENIIKKYQIHTVPFKISFGKKLFLDKLSMTSKQFYKMLESSKEHPKSSQPSYKTIENLFSFVATHYESIIAVHISNKLSGVYHQSLMAGQKIDDIPVSVFDSRHLSGSEGLIVLRIAQAIDKGLLYDNITSEIDNWVNKTKIFVDVDTLKYMVRGGRVSPAKGMLAKVLNVKPIVSIDHTGKGIVFDKSFSRNQNMKKILNIIKDFKEEGEVWNYSIVHAMAEERAQEYAAKLIKMLDKHPAYIMDISPVVGVHNGIGSVGISIMHK